MEGTIGEIRMFAGNFAPRYWNYCNGQTINISSNTALFSILGTVYGGNGTTNFQLPDLQGRTAVGAGNGPGLSPYALGQKSGVETTTLSTLQMPVHTHMVGGTISTNPVAIPAVQDVATQTEPSTVNFPAATAGVAIYASSPTPNVNATPYDVTFNVTNVQVGSAGASMPFSILPPYAVTNYVICMQGVFPQRN